MIARIKKSGAQHEVAVQLAVMLEIVDTRFVVKRVAQLARAGRDSADRLRQISVNHDRAPRPAPSPG